MPPPGGLLIPPSVGRLLVAHTSLVFSMLLIHVFIVREFDIREYRFHRESVFWGLGSGLVGLSTLPCAFGHPFTITKSTLSRIVLLPGRSYSTHIVLLAHGLFFQSV